MKLERKKILTSLSEARAAVDQLFHQADWILDCAEQVATCFRRGGKLLIAGNGGSLCDAMHFAEELTGFFREKRPPFPALALADPGYLSCVANDAGFDEVFVRGVEAFGKPEDILFVLTTSGNSKNLIRAVDRANEMGLTTVAFLGKTGGELKGRADYELWIEGFHTSDRIQEAHMLAIHILIEIVESLLLETPKEQHVACLG